MDITADASSFELALFRKAASAHRPIYGNLELLPLCNMNCDMCFVRLSPEEMKRQGRLRTLEEWKSVVKEIAQEGVLFLQLTGGEPLLYPDFKELYSFIRSQGIIVTINTNGTLIDEEWADFFAKYPPRRLNITLYGKDNETYERLCHLPHGFDKAIRGIKLLRERNVDVKLNDSLAKENFHDLKALFQIADELKVPMEPASYMFPATRERSRDYQYQSRVTPKEAAHAQMIVAAHGKTPEEFKLYAQSVLDRVEQTPEGPLEPCGVTCNAGQCAFIVNWMGHLQPCIILRDPWVPVFEIGFKKGWEEIVEKTREIQVCAECNACKLRNFCSRCAAANFCETGNMHTKPTYLCEMAEEYYRLMKEVATSEVTSETISEGE